MARSPQYYGFSNTEPLTADEVRMLDKQDEDRQRLEDNPQPTCGLCGIEISRNHPYCYWCLQE